MTQQQQQQQQNSPQPQPAHQHVQPQPQPQVVVQPPQPGGALPQPQPQPQPPLQHAPAPPPITHVGVHTQATAPSVQQQAAAAPPQTITPDLAHAQHQQAMLAAQVQQSAQPLPTAPPPGAGFPEQRIGEDPLVGDGLDVGADLAAFIGADPQALAALEDPNVDSAERAKIIEGAAALRRARSRRELDAVKTAQMRTRSPYFLHNCPTSDSGPNCPLQRHYGFPVHYHWANARDNVQFGILLNSGTGDMPRCYIVQGACTPAQFRDASLHPQEKHMLAVAETRKLAEQIGTSVNYVDPVANRITIGDNVLVWCPKSENDEMSAQRAQYDQDIQRRNATAYVDQIKNSPAGRVVRPFAQTLGEIADYKAHATREGNPFAGQVGGGRRQRAG